MNVRRIHAAGLAWVVATMVAAMGCASSNTTESPTPPACGSCVLNTTKCDGDTEVRCVEQDGCLREVRTSCGVGGTCGGVGICQKFARIELTFATEVAVSSKTRPTVSAVLEGGARVDVTATSSFAVDTIPSGDADRGSIIYDPLPLYEAPNKAGAHTLTATLAGTTLTARAEFTVRERKLVSLTKGALFTDIGGTLSSPSMVDDGTTLWVAYGGRAKDRRQVIQVTALVGSESKVYPLPGSKAQRRPSLASLQIAGKSVPCVAYEEEVEGWASVPKVACKTGENFEAVTLPPFKASAISSIRLATAGSGKRSDLYIVQDALGLVHHVSLGTELKGLDWSTAPVVSSAHLEVDALEEILVGYDATNLPFVVETRLELLPRSVTVARRMDIDGAKKDDSFVYLGGDQLGLASVAADRARHRRTGSSSLALSPGYVAFASGFKAGATRWAKSPKDGSTWARLVEQIDGRTTTFTSLLPDGISGTERSAAKNPALLVDDNGRLFAAVEVESAGTLKVGLIRRADTLTSPVSRVNTTVAFPVGTATNQTNPVLAESVGDRDGYILAFPTFSKTPNKTRDAFESFSGVEVWGFR